jgi:hypothetical protein
MSHHGYPSFSRIQAHLEALRQQEKDALEMLAQPETKPGTHAKFRALIQRIQDERRGLEQSVHDLLADGQLASQSVN